MTESDENKSGLPPDSEILKAIEEDNLDVLGWLCIPLGRDHENWRFAQDICVRLSGHSDEGIRRTALLGLSVVTMSNLKIEKNVVKPVLLRGLKDESPEVRSAAETAIQDINFWMKWRIGEAKRNKEREKRYHERKQKKS